MATFLHRTKGDSSPDRKPRVYFTCHSDDFIRYFDTVCKQIFKTHDCAIYYTEDMNEEIEEKYKESDLGQMNLFVIPVTGRLLTKPNRAMSSDFIYAKENNIPVLPLMMEPNLDEIYSREDKFGELQYLNPFANDNTAIKYEDKLQKYLDSVLISDKMAERIRNAFDAYIFLSYRKKDRHYANELMKMIHCHNEFQGVAIWYDEFLKPGESFRENIERMMQDSKLFTLLVTPSLLEYVDGKPNYVMEHEYPDAMTAGMEIIPTEMEKTNLSTLRDKYRGIPECVNPYQDEQLRKCLSDAFSRIAISRSDDSEHNFLLGLAYLEGIDVERNREKALELITSAAEAENIEAVEKLRDMYINGIGVKINHQIALTWAENAASYYKEHEGEEDEKYLTAINEIAKCHISLGHPSDAVPLLEKIHKCEQRKRGEYDEHTINALNNLAYAYNANNEPLRAFEATKKAYNMYLDALGKENRNTLVALNNLAMAYVSHPEPDFEKALELNREAYKLRLKLFGKLDRDTIVSQVNLGCSYSLIGKERMALSQLNEAYRLYCDAFDEESLDVIRILDMIASVHANCNHINKVIEIREKIYNTCIKIYGDDSPSIVSEAFKLATECMTYRKYKKAVSVLEKIYDIVSKAEGEKKSSTIMLSIAACYRGMGNEIKYREAFEKFQETN